MLSVKQFDSCTVKRTATSIFQSPQVNIILHSYPILSGEMILVDVSDILKHLFLHGGERKKKGPKKRISCFLSGSKLSFRPVLNATLYSNSSKFSPSEQVPQPNPECPIHPVLKQAFEKKNKSNLDSAFQLN